MSSKDFTHRRPQIEEDLLMEEAVDQEKLTTAGARLMSDDELERLYPHRPVNDNPTLPFHTLYQNLFEPLLANVKKKTGFKVFSKKQKEPHEIRRNIIERFIRRWRHEVGDDVFPVFRLNRDRIVYGLKEKAIAKQLIKVLRISKDSNDAYNLMHWKQPAQGRGATDGGSGDFTQRCFDAISRRPVRTAPGDMTIDEVNHLLDKLAMNTKEESQLPIFQKFYDRMNPHELVWLIRIILKQMKVGATEKTFFDCWHPDAADLFNVSSSLRRVCWELYDPDFRLNASERGVTLMSCFQPQLAGFAKRDFDTTLKAMRPEEEDKVFWIEEKMDGERMQMHMNDAGDCKFFSRKAKDYTDHYGSSLDDPDGTLTRHLKDAFTTGVKSIILDGEMITWDPVQDAMIPFGTLKTAVNIQKTHDDPTAPRPLFRVFDILYLNGLSLVNYSLRDRRKALEHSLNPVERRLELHGYIEATTTSEIKAQLQKVVELSTEGLVIKNPRTAYSLGDRCDDWLKVKPEYTNEFGEDLDCIIIGGYYGEGKRGGMVSSFMCGLKADGNDAIRGEEHPRYFSFFKVGGGFTAQDYSQIRHRLEPYWNKWDPKKPPKEWIELAGGHLQYERPDVWIKPEHSIIVAVKAASITPTDQFKMNLTLRFPRFKKLREDRDWTQAMTTSEFRQFKAKTEAEKKEKDFTFDQRRAKAKRVKKELIIAGTDKSTKPYEGTISDIFEGQNFFIITESTKPRKSKVQIEELVKANAGKIFQSENAQDSIRCIADKNVIKVAALKKKDIDVIRPQWLFDCIESQYILPLEAERHVLHANADTQDSLGKTVDKYGDSYARDVTAEDLWRILDVKMAGETYFDNGKKVLEEFKSELETETNDAAAGWMFERCLVYFDTYDTGQKNNIVSSSGHAVKNTATQMVIAKNIVEFAGGQVTEDFHDPELTHIIVGDDKTRLKDIRHILKSKTRIPRIATPEWIKESWEEKTLLDAENFPVS